MRNRCQFAIHGSVATCLNIVFKHCYYIEGVPSNSKTANISYLSEFHFFLHCPSGFIYNKVASKHANMPLGKYYFNTSISSPYFKVVTFILNGVGTSAQS